MNFRCSMECQRRDSCISYCIIESECRLTNFFISPQDGPNDSDHVTCFTSRATINHIVGAATTHSSARRSPSIHTQGIYNYDWPKTSSLLEIDVKPYMLFEFPTEVMVKTISILTAVTDLPTDETEIRIGSSMFGGSTNFSQLEFFGTFDNNVQRKAWNTLTVDRPKKGKFLAIVQTSGGGLRINFLEASP